MKTRTVLEFAAIGLAVMVLYWAYPQASAQNGSTAPAALAGQVTSQEEGPMEGVLVSAKRNGSTMTVTVATDQQGRYRFPKAKLDPGKYAVSIRAVGFDLDAARSVDIAASGTATVDLRLRPTADLASQLSNAEWLMSMPGTEQQKRALINCTGCHTLERIVRSKHNTEEFMQVMARMASYAPGSSPRFPQKRIASREGPPNPERFRKQAEWLSTVNLSSVSKWEYPLKTMPRPTGRATRVVVTEYDLPRSVTQPHDVILDPDGIAWYSDFGQQYLGRLDPKTGVVKEYEIPKLKDGSPMGGLDIELDREGNLWYGLMLQGGIAKFDRKAEKFQLFALPSGINSDVAQQAMVSPVSMHLDGKIWMNNVGIRGIHRMDLASGKFETFEPYKDLPGGGAGGMEGGGHSVYGIAADSKNNLYFMDFGNENIGRADAKTGALQLFPTPTRDSGPRRGRMDAQDRLWFAEYRGNNVAMFDTKTQKFTEWPMPTEYTHPYDVMVDKNGEVWTGGMTSDRIVRLDTKTGKTTEYLLPSETNLRRAYVDSRTTPVTFWVGNNHFPSVVKVEPLD
jgi:virginiamycin B lyase